MKENKLVLLKNFTLLLVEDDKELLENISSTLSIFFSRVLTAKNGAEALKLFQTNAVDMIITDYVMPIMSGYELCILIREENKNIPIVFTSNYTDSEKLLNLISLNLSDFIIKPIDYTQLIKTLLKMIDRVQESNLYMMHLNANLSYNFLSKEVYDSKSNVIHKLSKSEISLLELFLHQEGKIISTEMIEFALSPTDSKSEQAIKNLIYRLRKKLAPCSIINVQSMGYILKLTR